MESKEEVRNELLAEEGDLDALAARIGVAGLPHLDALVSEDNLSTSARAAYLAALIGGPTAWQILELAANSEHAVVRVIAASAIIHLPEEEAARIGDKFFNDTEARVRIQAAKSALKRGDAQLLDRVRYMAQYDPDLVARNFAAKAVPE